MIGGSPVALRAPFTRSHSGAVTATTPALLIALCRDFSLPLTNTAAKRSPWSLSPRAASFVTNTGPPLLPGPVATVSIWL